VNGRVRTEALQDPGISGSVAVRAFLDHHGGDVEQRRDAGKPRDAIDGRRGGRAFVLGHLRLVEEGGLRIDDGQD
jgi:hypothetical protein